MSSIDYPSLLAQADALLKDQSNFIGNAANLSSLIYYGVEHINWAGFYFLQDDELVLGPFSGRTACTSIALGKGVCGTAFAQNKTLLIDDVHNFDGHIACDAASVSELVVPFRNSAYRFNNTTLCGVLDIDSPLKARFCKEEKDFFEQLVEIYCWSDAR